MLLFYSVIVVVLSFFVLVFNQFKVTIKHFAPRVTRVSEVVYIMIKTSKYFSNISILLHEMMSLNLKILDLQ